MSKLLIIVNLLLLSFNGFSQSNIKVNSTVGQKQNFSHFLERFSEISVPFNYKKELYNVTEGKIRLIDIPVKDAVNYLKLDNNELYINKIDYNYDNDETVVSRVKNFPIAHLKFSLNDFEGIIYRMNTGDNSDSTFVFLVIFDLNGHFIDKIVVGERFTREDDWMSFVFLDAKHFKIFKYETNWANFRKKGQYYYAIDKNGPFTTVSVADFIIEDTGKIKKVKENPKQFLNHRVIDYEQYNADNDDIMNKY